MNIIGSAIGADENIVVAADGDVNFESSVDVESHYYRKTKTGLFGFSGSDKGKKTYAELQAEASSIGGGSTEVNAGGNIRVIASRIVSEDDINLTAVDEVLIAADTTLSQVEEWSRESGFFTGGSFFESTEIKSASSTQSTHSANVDAGGTLNINAGSAKVIGSNLNGDDAINITTDIGGIEIIADANVNQTSSNEKTLSISIGNVLESLTNPAELVKVEDGQLKVSLAEGHYTHNKDKSQDNLQTGSTLTSDGSITLNSAENILIEGSSLIGDRDQDGDGDVNLTAVESVLITEAKQTHESESSTSTGDAEVSFVVQHQGVELAKAILALKEAKKQVSDAKKALKEYKREASKLKDAVQQLSNDYDNKVPGVSLQAVSNARAAYDDFKGDEAWYKAGVAAAAISLAQRIVSVTQQALALGQSVGSYAFGFNAGIQIDASVAGSETTTLSTSSVASSISGENISITAGDAEGNEVLIQGSEILASDTIDISGNDVNILASQDSFSTRTESEEATITAAITLFGATGGATFNASYDRSMSKDAATTYTNSVLNADTINITSVDDVTIRGGNVDANEQLNLDVGDDLSVISVQNRTSGSSSSFGISGGFSLGGDKADQRSAAGGESSSAFHGTSELGNSGSGVNGGVRLGSGRYSSTETVVSTLTSGGEANINVGDNTAIVGAVIATIDEDGNDLGNLNLTTNTLDYEDLIDSSSSTNTQFSFDGSASITGGDGDTSDTFQTDAFGMELGRSLTKYSNSTEISGTSITATLGEGNIEIADLENSSDLDRLNRDVGNGQRELYDAEGNLDIELLIDPDALKIIADIAVDVFRQIKAQTVTINQVDTRVRDAIGNDELALGIAKNFVLQFGRKMTAEEAQVIADNANLINQAREVAQTYADSDTRGELADIKAGNQTGADTEITAGGTQELDGSVGDITLVGTRQLSSGEDLTIAANEIKEKLSELPAEQVGTVLIGVQLALAPAKGIIGLAGSYIVQAVAGEQIEAAKEELAVKAVDAVSIDSSTEVRDDHEFLQEAGNGGKGDERVEGANFLITILSGIGLGALTKKLGKKSGESNKPNDKGSDSDSGNGNRNDADDVAGSTPDVNPGYPSTGRTHNCANCAVATDATFKGNPASALPLSGIKGLPISKIPEALGIKGRFVPTKGLGDITTKMKKLGPGSTGVVFASRGPGQVGHVFNVVVNKRGKVKFWDGQSNTVPKFDGQGYKDFHFLNTTKK